MDAKEAKKAEKAEKKLKKTVDSLRTKTIKSLNKDAKKVSKAQTKARKSKVAIVQDEMPLINESNCTNKAQLRAIWHCCIQLGSESSRWVMLTS